MYYMQHVTRVGIRELRQRASMLLRRVERGERFEITDRCRSGGSSKAPSPVLARLRRHER